jgi:Tfp pilus assembly protein PilV
MNKSGFLLIELLIAISIFVLSVLTISRLQVHAVKTSRRALERMQLLTSITNEMENLKIGKKEPVFGEK